MPFTHHVFCRRASLIRGDIAVVAVFVSALTVASYAPAADMRYPAGTPALGAHYDHTGTTIHFRVHSSRAQAVHLYVYAAPTGNEEKLVVPMTKEPGSDVFAAEISTGDLAKRGVSGPVYYRYRAWGPNWPFDRAWTKGSKVGFVADVNAAGNRFNPNKLFLDPYAAEVIPDPRTPRHPNGSDYATGPDHRLTDTGPFAPKAIVLEPDGTEVGTRPTRRFREEVIYEVHVRGLTMLDPTVPPAERGTYAGAACKADYLRSLGVTAIEFLPVHEFDNDLNDFDPGSRKNDYWGYYTLGFFGPDWRPGGPTREFKAMVKAFHDCGLKVYLISWHGLDNRTYNELTTDNTRYYDDSGVDGNFNCANRVVRDLILDSLKY